MENTSSSPNPGSQVSDEAQILSCYVGPAAPAIEVIWDQLEFLATHDGHGCDPECRDCQRWEKVKRYLLQPFN